MRTYTMRAHVYSHSHSCQSSSLCNSLLHLSMNEAEVCYANTSKSSRNIDPGKFWSPLHEVQLEDPWRFHQEQRTTRPWATTDVLQILLFHSYSSCFYWTVVYNYTNIGACLFTSAVKVYDMNFHKEPQSTASWLTATLQHGSLTRLFSLGVLTAV